MAFKICLIRGCGGKSVIGHPYCEPHMELIGLGRDAREAQAKKKELKKKIAVRVRVARLRIDLSQEEAAKKLNIPRSSMSKIENGKQDISAQEIALMSVLYEVPAPWLLGEGPFSHEPKMSTRRRKKEAA